MSYAILRTKKLKSWSQIARVGRHNERQPRTLNADPERQKNNVNYRPELTGALVDRVREAIGDRQRRKDAVLAIEVLMAYSPDAEQEIDSLSWGIASMDWLEREFGRDRTVFGWCHMDEARIHVQACVIPIDPNARLNCKYYLGGPAKLSALQTRYAAAVAKFGLVRGEEGSKRKHVPIKELYRDSNLLEDEAKNAASIIELLRTPCPIKVPRKGALESHRDYENRINEHLRELLRRLWEQLQTVLANLIRAGQNIGVLRAERDARIAATKRTRRAEKQAALAERRAAKAEKGLVRSNETISRLEKQLAARCRELSLRQVARDLLKIAPEQTDTTSIFTTKRHRLTITADHFELVDTCAGTSSTVEGTNAIDLIVGLMRCKYSRAVEYLASRYDVATVAATCGSRAEAKAETLCRSPLPFSSHETREALERPEAIPHLALPLPKRK